MGCAIQNFFGLVIEVPKTIGKPYPSVGGSHRARLFFTNDDGVFMVKAHEAKMTKMREYERRDDRAKARPMTA